jgi:hypothetical protein
MTERTPLTIELRDGDPELQAISHVVCILARFQPEQRDRMIAYITKRFQAVGGELTAEPHCHAEQCECAEHMRNSLRPHGCSFYR